MVRACEENGVTFMAGHAMNFFNGVHHAKELINQGVIGNCFLVNRSVSGTLFTLPAAFACAHSSLSGAWRRT